MRYFLIYLGILTFIGCSNEADFKCAEKIDNVELFRFMQPDTSKYTVSDTLMLFRIKSLITPFSLDTSKIKVDYIFKTPNSMALDIYGIEQVIKIDSASCALFNNPALNLPGDFTLLFNYFDKKLADVTKTNIAALKRKNSR